MLMVQPTSLACCKAIHVIRRAIHGNGDSFNNKKKGKAMFGFGGKKYTDQDIEQYFDNQFANAPDNSRFLAGEEITDPVVRDFQDRILQEQWTTQQYLESQGKHMVWDENDKARIISSDEYQRNYVEKWADEE
jgi:hypothetical protein